MEFIKLSVENLPEWKESISNFMDRNIADYVYFHPHRLSYTGVYDEVEKNPKDYYTILVDLNRNIMGYGMLRGWQEGYEIPSLGIMMDKTFRGTGLSSAVMAELHTTAKERGAKSVRLSVFKDNAAAVKFYTRLGYVLAEKNKYELIGIKKL